MRWTSGEARKHNVPIFVGGDGRRLRGLHAQVDLHLAVAVQWEPLAGPPPFLFEPSEAPAPGRKPSLSLKPPSSTTTTMVSCLGRLPIQHMR
jgi:hypothetical protein